MGEYFKKRGSQRGSQKNVNENYYKKHFGGQQRQVSRSNVTKKKFSNAEVDKLRTLVELQNKREHNKYYSIKVDREVVVPKTNDPRQFDYFTQFVDQGTEAVEIHLYHGQSNNCNKHILYFNETPQGVNGVSPDQINEIVKNAIEEDRRINHIEYMEKRLEELEEENESLHEEIDELKAKTDFSALGDLAKAGFNAWAVSKSGGTLGEAPQSEIKQESEVEVEIEQETTEEDKEHDKAKSNLMNLADKYEADSVNILAHLAEKMLKNPQMEKEALELFKKYSKESQKSQKQHESNKET